MSLSKIADMTRRLWGDARAAVDRTVETAREQARELRLEERLAELRDSLLANEGAASIEMRARDFLARAAAAIDRSVARAAPSCAPERSEAATEPAASADTPPASPGSGPTREPETERPDASTSVRELLELSLQNAKEVTDRAASRVASLYTEATGRPTTPEQVKSVALRVGAAAVFATVVGSLLEHAGESSGGASTTASGASSAGAGGFDQSFEGQVSAFFADKGGLHIETQVVDQDGGIVS